MKERILVTAGLVLLAVVSACSWYWYGYGGQAARMAKSPQADVRLQAVRKLRGKSSSLALGILHGLCDDPEVRVAVHAVRAIGAGEDGANHKLLVEILSGGGRGRIRGEAAAALGNYRKRTSVQMLIRVLREGEDGQTRAGAAKGLARLRDAAALEPLVDALNDSELEVRAVAIVAIQKVIGARFAYQSGASPEVRRQQIAAIRSLLKRPKPR